MAGRPKGSPNKQDSKPWRDALRVEANSNPKRLRDLAAKTFDMAAEGDMAAIREIGDRLDGKAVQQTDNEHKVTGDITIILERPNID